MAWTWVVGAVQVNDIDGINARFAAIALWDPDSGRHGGYITMAESSEGETYNPFDVEVLQNPRRVRIAALGRDAFGNELSFEFVFSIPDELPNPPPLPVEIPLQPVNIPSGYSITNARYNRQLRVVSLTLNGIPCAFDVP